MFGIRGIGDDKTQAGQVADADAQAADIAASAAGRVAAATTTRTESASAAIVPAIMGLNTALEALLASISHQVPTISVADSAVAFQLARIDRELVRLDRQIEANREADNDDEDDEPAAPAAGSLEDLTDVATMSQASGDLLQWNGAAWSNVGTSSLGITSGGSSLWSENGSEIYYTGGNVGIGTTDPNSPLNVVNDENTASIRLQNTNEDYTAAIGFQDESGGHAGFIEWANSDTSQFGGDTLTMFTFGYYPLIFGTFNQERIRIMPEGNVGIGTSEPEETLHVANGSAGTVTADADSVAVLESSGNAYLNFLTPGASSSGILFGHGGGANDDGAIYYNPAGNIDGLSFQTDGAVEMVILDGGNVGIGTTTPGQELTVEGDAHITGSLFDSAGSAGSAGMVLQSTGSGFQWVATSSLAVTAVTEDTMDTHTFTGTETWTPQDDLAATTTFEITFDATDLDPGMLVLTVDDMTVARIYPGETSSRIVSASDSISVTADDYGFDASSAATESSFSVTTEDTAPYDVAFNTDGTKMFVVGDTGEDVNEYDLSTAFDITTAVFATSTSVAAQETDATGIAFNTDGTKMFIAAYGAEDILEYHLSTAFDISTATYDSSFAVSLHDGNTHGVAFNEDGTKMFVLGRLDDEVSEYHLGAPFDISTAVFDSEFSVTTEDTNPVALAFNRDGTKMFVLGGDGQDVNEYALTSAFEVATASFTDSFSVSSQDTVPRGLEFNTNGTQMYVVGNSSDTVYSYSIGGAFSGTAHVSIIRDPDTGGADLAELYATAESDLGAGDVVALDPENAGYVKKATGARNERLVGIVATKPGIVLDDNAHPDAMKVPVALAGRVPVKISTENGTIAIGDLITVSDSASGTARKANPGEPIIGYALAAYAADAPGTVEVFVKLELADALFLQEDGSLAPLASSTATSTEPVSQNIFERVFELVSKFVDGVLTVVGIVVEKLTAEEVHTKVLCIDGVCITKDELTEILNETDVVPHVRATSTEDGETDADGTNKETVKDPNIESPDDMATSSAPETATSSANATGGDHDIDPSLADDIDTDTLPEEEEKKEEDPVETPAQGTEQALGDASQNDDLEDESSATEMGSEPVDPTDSAAPAGDPAA